MAASSATLMILPVVCGNRPTGNLFQIAAMSAKLSPKTELFWGKQTTQNDSRVHGRVSFQGPISRGHLKMEARFGKVAQNVRETVVPDPDYRIPVILLGSAAALIYKDNLLPAAPIGLLGLLLLFQTTRVRFVFDDESLEVKIGDQLKESGENVFVGGKNRWKYSTFVNWELWWPSFPVLVYFKETQTKPEGQVHFFPVIFNGKQLYDVMVERAGFSQNSGPK